MNTSSRSDGPVHVCFVIDNLAVAGVEGQLLLLLDRLDRKKVVPSLCVLNGGSELSRSLEPQNCPVLRLGVRSLRTSSSLAAAVCLSRFLRREHVEIVHALCPDSLYFATPVARLSGVPCVVRFRVNLGYWMTPIDRWLGRLFNRLVDATVVNCDACRKAVIGDENAPPKSITVIPNGIDLSQFATVSDIGSLNRGDGVIRVGAVANLRPVKNLELLVQAAAMLSPNHSTLRFQIAGQGESLMELQSLVCSLGIGGRVEFLGTIAHVPHFLASLDVAVLCSRSEGSPNAIMEYMAAARPIVATSVGGIPELIEHETHGLLIEPGNAHQLASAIDRLLRNRGLAARLAANARQRAYGEFGVDVQARRYEAFYIKCYRSRCHAHRADTGRVFWFRRTLKDSRSCR